MSNPATSRDETLSGVVQAEPVTVPLETLSQPWGVVSYTDPASIPYGVIDSWCTFYQRSAFSGCVPNNVAGAVWAESIRQLLTRGATMYVAINPAKPDHWLGYALLERTGDGVPVVHFAFTKPTYRREGVLRSLLAAAGIDRKGRLFWTFQTGSERRVFPAGRFEPSVARRQKA